MKLNQDKKAASHENIYSLHPFSFVVLEVGTGTKEGVKR